MVLHLTVLPLEVGARFFILSFKNMSQRRMFSPDIVESEEFLTMPISSQALYFHLGMGADDDGFIQPKMIMKMLGANDDDLKVLLAKRFILAFESGVVVIKHWLIHNMIRVDRYKTTRFQDEKKTLKIKENKAYTELGCQNDNQMAPQVRLGKVRLGKVRLGKDSIDIAETSSAEKPFSSEEYIQSLLKDKKKHLNIIGKYFLHTRPQWPSKKAANAEMLRWAKDASILAEYPDDKIDFVYSSLMNDPFLKDKWTLQTITKKISTI
jgi:hypothetical protein